MELYLVRHGETESNKQRRYLGWTESPLSEEGLRQAEKAAFFLAVKKIEGLYCSDLKRAVGTARIIGSSCGLKPTVTPLLREVNFGHWEGLTFDEIEAKWGDRVSRWFDDPFHKAAPGGESLSEVCVRMKAFLEQLTMSCRDGQRVAAVSHGGSIRALLYYILGLDRKRFWDIKVDNASISLIRREGEEYKVIYYNRVDHLSAGGKLEELSNDL